MEIPLGLKPPAFHRLPAIDVSVCGQRAMGHVAAAGKDVLRIDRDDRTAVVTHDLLQLPVHRAAAVRVQLGAGLDQQSVEAFVLPVRIVPGQCASFQGESAA